MVAYTKRQVIDHIHWFLATQLNRTGATYWTCVLRDGQLKVVAPCRVRDGDLVLADCTENLNAMPLRTVIHQGVDKHWQALSTANMNIQEVALQRQ